MGFSYFLSVLEIDLLYVFSVVICVCVCVCTCVCILDFQQKGKHFTMTVGLLLGRTKTQSVRREEPLEQS